MWKIFLNHKKKKSWQKMMAHHPAVRANVARKKAAAELAAVVVDAGLVLLPKKKSLRWKQMPHNASP